MNECKSRGRLIFSIIFLFTTSFLLQYLFDQRMARDVESLVENLGTANMPSAQVEAIRLMVLDISRNTLSYVSLTAMPIFLILFALTLQTARCVVSINDKDKGI